jgi:hypothetical protein
MYWSFPWSLILILSVCPVLMSHSGPWLKADRLLSCDVIERYEDSWCGTNT